MNIFVEIFEFCDIIGSFFYNLMLIDFSEFRDFLTGDFTLSFYTIVNDLSIDITMFNFPLPSLDFAVDTLVDLITFIFYPIPFAQNVFDAFNTPFYLCFLSFFVNQIIFLALFKLVAFIIELIPFE